MSKTVIMWLLVIAVMITLFAPLATYRAFDWAAWVEDAQNIEEFNLIHELQYAMHFELVEGNNPLQDAFIDWLLNKFPVAAVAQSFARVYLAGRAMVYFVNWIIRCSRYLSPWEYVLDITPISWEDNITYTENYHEQHGGGSGHQGGR